MEVKIKGVAPGDGEMLRHANRLSAKCSRGAIRVISQSGQPWGIKTSGVAQMTSNKGLNPNKDSWPNQTFTWPLLLDGTGQLHAWCLCVFLICKASQCFMQEALQKTDPAWNVSLQATMFDFVDVPNDPEDCAMDWYRKLPWSGNQALALENQSVPRLWILWLQSFFLRCQSPFWNVEGSAHVIKFCWWTWAMPVDVVSFRFQMFCIQQFRRKTTSCKKAVGLSHLLNATLIFGQTSSPWSSILLLSKGLHASPHCLGFHPSFSACIFVVSMLQDELFPCCLALGRP